MTREYRVMLDPEPGGGYSVWVPVLPGCVSQGETTDEALVNIREAIQAYIESALKHGDPLPSEETMTEAIVEVMV